MSLSLINRFRGENASLHGLKPAIVGDSAKEAGAIAFVAGPADLPSFDQQDIGVAIDANLDDMLNMAGCSSFMPGGAPGSRVEVGLSGFPSAEDRGLVHPSHHQNFAAVGVLNDGGDQTVGRALQLGQKGGEGGGIHKAGGFRGIQEGEEENDSRGRRRR